MAKNGAHFPNAVAQGPMCGASWNGLLTNLYSHNLGFYRNGHLRYLPEETWTFPPILQKAGYQTASIGKSHIKASADHPRASKAEALRSYGFDYARCTGGRYALWKAIKDGKPVDEVPFIQHRKNREKYDQFVKDNTSFGNPITIESDIDYLDGYTAQVGVE